MFIHHAGEIGADQYTAVFHKGVELLFKTVAEHKEHGSHHNLVAAQIRAVPHVTEIHGNALFPESTVVAQHRVKVVHGTLLTGLGIINGPAVLPVKDNANIGMGFCVINGLQLFQRFANFRHVGKHTGIAFAVVVHYSTVEHFSAATAFPPLEVHDALAAVRHCLHTGQQVHARFLQLVVRLPVHLGRGGFHEDKGGILQGTHDVVVHGKLCAPGKIVTAVPAGVTVPGYHIHGFGHGEIVIAPEPFHHVDGYLQGRIHGLNGIPFHFDEGLALIRQEALPIHRHGAAADLTQRAGCFNLGPVRIPLAPEACPPALVQLFQGAVPLLQPVTEGLLAPGTMALAGKFIAQVPQNDRRVMGVPLGQRRIHFSYLPAIHRGGRAMIVTLAKVHLLVLTIDT